MSGGSSIVEHIDAVDALARTLFMRAKQASGNTLDDAAASVRQLHLALRHLRIEAADPDSRLNGADASVYSRQLKTLLENCTYALNQLTSILENYDSRSPASATEKAIAVGSRLTQEKTNVEIFLDTVQLRSPANESEQAALADSPRLEDIQQKVDKVASRVFKRRSAELSHDSDWTWQEFKAELEKEGFSPQVLRNHKNVLRAYIRELDAASEVRGGSPPTVQGLLEYEANMAPQSVRPPRVPPKIPLGNADRVEREKYDPSTKTDRVVPAGSQPRYTNGHRSPSPEGSPTIITTRDLIFMTGLTHSMADMDLNHHRPGANGLDAPQSSTPQPGTSPNVSSYTPYEQAMRAPTSNPTPRLAPDRYGREIPIDAPWTKMNRSLISSEVLNQAGVRYEARPDFVAVLGRLSKEQVAEFLRQSAECRAARSGRHPRSTRSPPRRSSPPRHERQEPKNSHGNNDDDVLWDSDDTVENDRSAGKGTKSYPYIVSAPERPTKASPRGSTVKPKPILKNKNENHVHFAGTEPYEVDPRASPPRSSRDGGKRNYNSGSSSSRHNRRRDDDSDRDERRDRDRDRRNTDRSTRKSSLGDTIGAVGIGGAAVSLLTVLAQAAVGM